MMKYVFLVFSLENKTQFPFVYQYMEHKVYHLNVNMAFFQVVKCELTKQYYHIDKG